MSDIKSNQTEVKSSFKKKTNGYKSNRLHAKRARKRDEAELRQEKHNSLSTAQKIAKATKRGGSVKELARLNQILKAETKENEIKKATSPNELTPKVTQTDQTVTSPKAKVKKSIKKKS